MKIFFYFIVFLLFLNSISYAVPKWLKSEILEVCKVTQDVRINQKWQERKNGPWIKGNPIFLKKGELLTVHLSKNKTIIKWYNSSNGQFPVKSTNFHKATLDKDYGKKKVGKKKVKDVIKDCKKVKSKTQQAAESTLSAKNYTVIVLNKKDDLAFIKRVKPNKKKAIDAALKGCKLYFEPHGKAMQDACYVDSINGKKYSAPKKKSTGKPLKAEELVSFILNNVITIDYDGKKESYKFEKVKRTDCQNYLKPDSSSCDDFNYEVHEGTKLAGKGTWTSDKMNVSKFSNLNKRLRKNSIKLTGYKHIYFQVYKKLDRVSTYAWTPGVYEDPNKNKKDEQINREILNITSSKNFENQLEQIERVKKAEEERIAKEKKAEEEKRIAE